VGLRRDAVEHTARIEDGFFQRLADLGWYGNVNPEQRRGIEGVALGEVGRDHGEHAKGHCARLLEGGAPVSPGSVRWLG